MTKRLYKSNHSKMVDGVCGGVAEYLNLDPTVIRLLWVVFSCMGWGIVAYIVCSIIVPRDPGSADNTFYNGSGNGNVN